MLLCNRLLLLLQVYNVVTWGWLWEDNEKLTPIEISERKKFFENKKNVPTNIISEYKSHDKEEREQTQRYTIPFAPFDHMIGTLKKMEMTQRNRVSKVSISQV